MEEVQGRQGAAGVNSPCKQMKCTLVSRDQVAFMLRHSKLGYLHDGVRGIVGFNLFEFGQANRCRKVWLKIQLSCNY